MRCSLCRSSGHTTSETNVGYDLTSSFVLSAIILWKPIPTPSMTARKTAHMIAEFLAALTPPRTAKAPPVKKPAMTAKCKSLAMTPNLKAHRNKIAIPHGLTGKHTSIVRIFLLSDTLDRTVERREHTTPNTKVTTENRRTSLDGCDGTYPALSVGAVSETLYTVPDSTTNCL